MRGRVGQVPDAEADAYFAARAPATAASAPGPASNRVRWRSRFALEKAAGEERREIRHRRGAGFWRPPHWTGFRILPQSLEFWMDKPFRLHDVSFSRAWMMAAGNARAYIREEGLPCALSPMRRALKSLNVAFVCSWERMHVSNAS